MIHLRKGQEMSETLQEINIEWIIENPHQPRKCFVQEDLEELAASIEEIGLVHPPVVRQMHSKKFELVAGERRLRALKLLGWKKAPVVVRRMEESFSAHSALIENIQRVDLNAIEVAYALKELMEKFQLTQEMLADKVGKKRSTVANFLRLLNLPQDIQENLKKGNLTMGHAKAALALPVELQSGFCQEILSKNLSVRQTEEKAKEFLKRKEKKKEKKDVHLLEIKSLLEAKFGTKADIGNSKISFDYYGWDDLDRLLELFGIKHVEN